MIPHTSTAQPVQFADLFSAPLPTGLREQTAGMAPDDVFTIYGHAAGPLRLGHWECTDAARPAGQLGPQARNFQATIAFGDRIATSTAAAGGPVAALTAMLHDSGVAVEMLKFQGNDIRIEYTGKIVSADEIKFTRKVADFATEELVAKRSK